MNEIPTQNKNRFLIFVLLIVLLLALGTGTAAYYYESSQQLSSLNSTVASLKSQIVANQLKSQTGESEIPVSNATAFNINPEEIYNYSSESVVTVEGLQTSSSPLGSSTTQVLGSGFVVEYSGSYYVVTNFHVVDGDSNLSITFSNGDAYSASVVGADPYSDLAVVSSKAPASEYHLLGIASSSTLKVGDPVLAIGNPFGLSGSMTFGIVSQLGRTIQESSTGGYPISDVIQISTPINPGNSGGPLFNSNAQVVGITTAVVSGSQGVGFAIPSDTILRELPYLITTGSYNLHPYLGITSVDMSYDLSQSLGTNVTYGVLVESVTSGGPASNAGIRGGTGTVVVDGQQYQSGGDIIASINGTRIVNGDALSSWLQEHALPNEIVQLGVYRSGSFMMIQITLGARPPIS